MQSLKHRQLGATNWAFIITLILLLVFIWMWFQETDQRDKLIADRKQAEARAADLDQEGQKLADLLEELSARVGWERKNVTLQHIRRANMSFAISDAAIIKANFDPEGVVPGAEEGSTKDGILKTLISSAQLTFEREARLHTTKTGEEKEHSFKTLSTEFKDKLRGVQAKWGEIEFSRPIPPADPDDVQGKQEYASALQEWERKVAEYSADLKALSEMEGWTEYSSRIGAPGQWGDPTKEGVTVHYYQYADTGTRTIESALVGLDKAFEGMGAEIRANMETWGQEITQLRKDNKAKEDSITQLQGQLQTEQQAHTNDVSQLQDRINQEQERANRNAIAKTNSDNELQRIKDDSSKSVAALKRDVEARKEQNRLLKEKRDLVIARDDVDGSVLVSNNTLGTAMIDLGAKDKAFVGQKFVVSALDRAGNRVNKGEVMVIKVTGDHSAKTRILAGTAGRGDRLHNPFYQPGEKIYIYFAAKLDKWPKEMAAQRLAAMNVTVQDAPDGNTHYIVVPNSWSEPTTAKAGDGEEADDEGTAAANPLEAIMKTARLFGANVITESLLDAFLDY